MPNRLETNNTDPSAKRHWPLFPIVVGGIMLLILLVICLFPYWFNEYVRQGKEKWTRRQMAEVKAGETTSISDPVPEVLGEIVQDRECADKITEVWIGESTGARISDERFRDLKRLPHLRTVHVWYVGVYKGGTDTLLANISGMESVEELSLYHSGVTAEGLRYAAGFPRLKQLYVDRVDDKCLEAIKRLQKALPNCKVDWQPPTEDERKMLLERDRPDN